MSDVLPGCGPLEALPVEIQLKIMRCLLLIKNSILLEPVFEFGRGVPAGTLGILTVSKHFSELALGVFYGENNFELNDAQYDDDDITWADVVSLFPPPPLVTLANGPRVRSAGI